MDDEVQAPGLAIRKRLDPHSLICTIAEINESALRHLDR
jgi:hypothetical protein